VEKYGFVHGILPSFSMAILNESTGHGAFLPFLPLRLNKLEIAGMAPKNKHTAGPRAEKKMKQIRVFFWCYCWMKFAI